MKAPVAKKASRGFQPGQIQRFVQGHSGGPPVQKSFHEHFAQCGPNDCWEWQGKRDKPPRKPYGCFWIPAIKQYRKAHRVSYERFVGPIPAGLNVCHSCDNPPCVNPAHLFVGTQADNLADMAAKGRSPSGSRNGMSKLTDDEALEVRGLYDQGWRQPDIARAYGVSPSLIYQIGVRKIWTHLPEALPPVVVI